jgi:hypothetical protein
MTPEQREALATVLAHYGSDPRVRPLHELRDQEQALLTWAVGRWRAEVEGRPLVNKNGRPLDDAWRQVIRFAGGDPDALIGPAHDALVARGFGAA